MPIEIREISIKADIYPGAKPAQSESAGISRAEIERLKKEITIAVTHAVLQKLPHAHER